MPRKKSLPPVVRVSQTPSALPAELRRDRREGNHTDDHLGPARPDGY